MKFTESQLEQAFIHLLQQEEMQHVLGNDLRKAEVTVAQLLFLENSFQKNKILTSFKYF